MNSIFSDFHIPNFTILQTCVFNSTVVSVLDLKTDFSSIQDSFGAVDFSMDDCSRWGVNNRVELEKMSNFKIFEILV